MSFYNLVKPFLFQLSPERAHNLALFALKNGLIPADHHRDDPVLACRLWGLGFPNPVGLAAGFDKNGAVICPMLAQGFGFVEAGTVTPRPQVGNSTPRLYRLRKDQAIINRMGFNNQGLEVYARNLARRTGLGKNGLVGANIGANKDSDDPAQDYETGLRRLLGLADYFTVNISSPNTPGLRKLQGRAALDDLLSRLMVIRDGQADQPPLLVKIAPDLEPQDRQDIADTAIQHRIDGLIISNTTVGLRDQLRSEQSSEPGGLSGRPLFDLSTTVLSDMYQRTEGKIPLIGVGGIDSGDAAYRKIRAGASLVQLYSALIFHGPGLVQTIKQDLTKALKRDGFSSVAAAVGADHR